MGAEPVSGPDPAALSQLRSTYFSRQEEALRPVRRWYAEELERLEKALTQRGDIPGAAKVREERAVLEEPALIIVKASWGTKDNNTDITRRLQTLVRGNKLDLVADDGIAETDPARGLKKQAVITYRLGEKERTVTVKQFDRIKLP